MTKKKARQVAETPQPIADDADVRHFATLAEALADVAADRQGPFERAAPFPPGGRELTRDEAREFLSGSKVWPASAPNKGKRGPPAKSPKMLFRGAYHKIVRLSEIRVKKRAGEKLRAAICAEVWQLKRDKVPRHRWRARIAGIRNIGVDSDRIGRVLKEMFPRLKP